MRRERRHRFFWPLIALGSFLESLAAASFATAVFSDPLPRGWTSYAPVSTEVLGRTTSLDWSTDRRILVATAVFTAAGLAAYSLAARLR